MKGEGGTRDVWLLFAARSLRLFAYGGLSVVLVFYLVGVGLTEGQTGALLTLTLLGDTAISLWITTRADRIGRRRMLVAGALLMAAAGFMMTSTTSFWLLVLVTTVGVISPSGHEVGPFLPIEQAALTSLTPDRRRTQLFGWYALTGALATATGSLAAGWATTLFERGNALSGYRVVVMAYGVIGILLAAIFVALSRRVEVNHAHQPTTLPGPAGFGGLGESRPIVLRLSALFALDAFGGGFIAQSFAAYWFHLRFGIEPAVLGPIFFVANVLAGVSALVAARMAARFGLIRTMVWTHLPSNVLLLLIPLMPTLPLAVALLLVRFSISQMDVPTRQSYVMAVVRPHERSAAGGVTGVARTIGAGFSPVLVGFCFARPSLVNVPFFVAGALKIAYDLILYVAFRSTKPPEELSG